MADYIFKANTDTIRSVTDKIAGQKTQMDAYMTEMQSKIKELENYFKGEAGTAFFDKYTTVQNNVSKCLTNLDSEITKLRTAAGIFEEAGNKTRNDVNGLSTEQLFTNN